ncbi:MAG: TolC family protein [Gemmatimonadales bacterium]
MRNRSVLALAIAAAIPVGLGAQDGAPLPLSFAAAVSRAAGAAPLVTLAGFRTDEARARVREARAPLLPGLSATGSWVNQTLNKDAFGFPFPNLPGFPSGKRIGPFDLVDARLRVTQTLFDYAGIARVRAARSQLAGVQADSGLAAEAAAQATALAYLQTLRARAIVAARQADSALAAELVRLAQAQLDAEVGTAIDVTRARTQLVAAVGGLALARNLEQRARIDLAGALGLEPDTPLELTDTLAAALPLAELPLARDSLIVLALERRPDLAAEQARGFAARRASSAIAAERLPRVDLSANYGAIGVSFGEAIATRLIALQVTIPILDGFRRESRQAEQQAGVRASELRVAELRRQVAADVDAARLDLASAEQQQAIAIDRLRLAEEELDQSQERFTAGVTGNIEVINAQLSFLRARDADIDARFAAAVARVALARAVGVARLLH